MLSLPGFRRCNQRDGAGGAVPGLFVEFVLVALPEPVVS